jgi:hypothetical protein
VQIKEKRNERNQEIIKERKNVIWNSRRTGREVGKYN